MQNFIKSHKKWVEDNPLRQFRKQQNLSINLLASMLGVGFNSIQRWEGGEVIPKPENMDKLNKLIGDDFEANWNEWMKNKPEL